MASTTYGGSDKGYDMSLWYDSRPLKIGWFAILFAVGAEVVDFGGKGRCCGFPILTANETNSMAMVAAHTGDAKARGADCMVTPCPLCHLNLDGGQPRAEALKGQSIGLPILHLPQLIGLSLGFNPDELRLKRHIVSTRIVAEKVQLLT